MKTDKIKIIFLGTPEIAGVVLAALLKASYPISSAVTMPDKPIRRSKELIASPVKTIAKNHNIPVYQPQTKLELEEYISSAEPDLIIVCAYGMIVTKKTLEASQLGAINVHPSLLPKYRGPSPIAGPILAGDKATGTTIMLMSEGMDEGDILAQEEIGLNGKETTESLTKTLSDLSAKLLTETLPDYLEGNITPKKQDDSLATYTKLARKEDGLLDFSNETALEIERKSRAYDPWPGVYTYFNDLKLDLFNLSVAVGKAEPGQTTVVDSQIHIGTKEGDIVPHTLRIEGKKKLPVADFMRGYPKIAGAKLGK